MYIRRPCGCRCVQYSILGGKAQGVRAIFLRQWIFSFLVGQGRVIPHPVGACPSRSRLTLPPLYPAGGLPSLPPADPAFSLLCCPHPPDPLPLRGRGRLQDYFAGGYRPRHPCPEPPAALTDPAEAAPCGAACLLCRPLPLPLACFVAPISPTPFPSGEGGDQGYFMQGASPLASPGLNPGGTGEGGEPRTRRVACPLRCRLTLPPLYPAGGLPSLPPAAPAFSFASTPIPPAPFPSGEGGDQGYFMQGASPLASPALNRLRHLQTLPCRSPAAEPGRHWDGVA